MMDNDDAQIDSSIKAPKFPYLLVCVVVLSVILIIAMLIFQKRGTEEVSEDNETKETVEYECYGKLYMESNAETVKVDDDIIVDVYVDTDTCNIDGVDAVILYNDNLLEISDISEGGDFSTYPLLQEGDNSIRISGLAEVDEPLTGNLKLAVIKIKAKQKGEAKLAFEFEEDSTVDSNISKHEENEDMLHEVIDIKITIE